MNEPKPTEEYMDEAEERVEKMIASGRKIMQDAIEKYRPVAIFAGFSGGNDSIVTTHFACEEFGAAAFHANTLIGLEESRVYARKKAEQYGWHFVEYKAEASGPPKKHKDGTPFDEITLPLGKWIDGDTAYEEFCFNFGIPGPGMHPRMYQRLKERSFKLVKRDAKKGYKFRDSVMFVTGIRHDESTIRAGYKKDTQKMDSSIWVSPFYWQTKVDFELYRQEFNLSRNPVSDIIGISGECLCGTMGSRDELELVGKINPETKKYIESLESRCESLGLPCIWANRIKKEKKKKVTDVETQIFGKEPTFQPACVGCLRRGPK